MMERQRLRHTMQVRVRNYEIDWQGIVHNANYLLYCEAGRIGYLQELGLMITQETIQQEFRMVVVRNEINYRSPAHFGDTLIVHTGITAIGNTSFTFEGIVDDALSGRIIAENVSVHVWLDKTTGRPIRVPDDFRALVVGFEGENLSPIGDGEAPHS